MSVETWLAEFYPQKAFEVSIEEALDHSLQKWRGALPENLTKHQLAEVPIPYSSATCALCHHYYSESCDDGTDSEQPACLDCPIVKSGQPDCSNSESAYNHAKPQTEYYKIQNPSVMIVCLEKAKEST